MSLARLMRNRMPIALAIPLLLCASSIALAKTDKPEIVVLSSRPDTVTGGDALVEVRLPDGASLDDLDVILNGEINVTPSFHFDSQSRLMGLVQGLRLGENELEARIGKNQGPKKARIELINYSRDGPVISGPHQKPYICETQVYNLGPALDENCNANTRVEYLYRSSTTNTFKPYDPAAPTPADLQQTTTSTGNTVPYIVRRETGVINRAVYQIAFLHVPGQPLPSPWTSTPGWNQRLVYIYGGGCGSGYHQGRTTGLGAAGTGPNGIPDDRLFGDYGVAKGYALVASSLNVFGNVCNEVLSAETTMMVKEYFVEHFGVPVYTIGHGGSGGAMQQHLITNAYPGLLDGILPSFSFQDTVSFLPSTVAECVLLDQAFKSSALPWSDAQKGAVGGFNTFLSCTLNGPSWRNAMVVPTSCDSSVPASAIYNATSNPGGVRCAYADYMANFYPTDPKTGFAGRPFDNVGVQYGLNAFNAGTITADQFIDLNARVGGFDVDGNVQHDRMQADPVALAVAYRTGRLNNAGGGFASVPIIDIRAYWDLTDNLHDSVRTEIMRARLIKANGHANNQVRFLTATVGATDLTDPNTPIRQAFRDALDAMDAWLAKIAADKAPAASELDRIVRNKPAGLVDSCYLTQFGRLTDYAQCLKTTFPPHGNPRLAAGGPLTQDILKCRLKPVSRADYVWGLSDSQLAQLRQVFPDGVCDYSKPSFGQTKSNDTWLAFPRPGFGVPIDSDDLDDQEQK